MSRDASIVRANGCDGSSTDRAPVIEIDPLGVVTHWSAGATALLGWRPAEVEGRTLSEIVIAPDERARFEEWNELSRTSRLRPLEELRLTTREGLELEALLKLLPSRGSLRRISVRALTAEMPALVSRRRAPKKKEEGERLIQDILNFLPHAIFWKDREGRFLGGNARFASYVSSTASIEELIGKTDHDFFPQDQAAFFRQCDLTVMETGEPMLDVEEPIRRENETRILLTSKVPLRDASGVPVGVLGIFTDITERKRMERALEEATQVAQSAARAKSEFLTVASHELRTPLTMILGPLDLLLSRQAEEAEEGTTLATATRMELERIRRNARRLHSLVNDILDVAKAESGRDEVEWDAVDVAALVRDVVSDAAGAADARGIALSLVEHGPVGVVPLDRGKCEKILFNLLGNALKFTHRGGRIAVDLTPLAGGRFELSVSDTGIGIAPHDREHLFERFHQLDSSSRRKYEGTGLGLSLVKPFAEVMGGRVSVESEPGVGSRFAVCFEPTTTKVLESQRIPATLEHRPFAEVLPVTLNGSSLADTHAHQKTADGRVALEARGRVLVVEDNADMRDFLLKVLARDDYMVVGAEDGCAGLAAARASSFDVIVSDIMMPCMDGMELVAHLKEDPALRNVPVILLTAKTTTEELVGGLAHGADDYLRKPFSPSELSARVNVALRLRRTIRELEVTLETLRSTQESLVQSEKMAAVGTLIAGLSHELNNPLAAITMSTELLMKNPSSAAIAARALPVIRTQVERCSHLVQALLDFSRKKQLVREQVSVSALLEPLHYLASPLAERRGIQLDLEGTDAAAHDAKISVCLQEMETAILNLVTNAIAATPDGGTVAIRARRAVRNGMDGIVVSVVDTGPGIAEDVVARIFDPFFTTKPPGEGTGLGLPLARKIVEAHGGGLMVESRVGRGTEAAAWLPVSETS